jgi:prophage tail gpP-like protein
VQDENSLSQIATRAYGDPTFWRRIWNANQTALRSGNPDIVFPGETIIIPFLPEREIPQSQQQSGKDPEGIYIDLDGYELRPMTCRIMRTMDTVANAIEFTIPWQPGLDEQLDNRVTPKKYTPMKVSIGSDQVLTGRLYKSASTIGNGTTLTLSGFTPTIDIVDSTVKPPLEENNITLEAQVKKLVEPLGFTVKVLTDTGGAFDRVTAQKGEQIFNFLSRLSRQRGVLLSNDVPGNITIITADTGGAPIATLEQGVSQGVTGWGLSVDGRSMFNTYRAVAEGPLDTFEGVSQDNAVPISRFKEVSADESTGGNVENAARWARNKTIADALSFSLTSEGFRNPLGDLWIENTQATIISPAMFLKNGFNFLINRVEYVLDSNGRSTVLSFVPPTMYSNGDIVEPW